MTFSLARHVVPSYTCPRRFRAPMKRFLNMELQKEGRNGRMVVWDLTDKEEEQMEVVFTVGKHDHLPPGLLYEEKRNARPELSHGPSRRHPLAVLAALAPRVLTCRTCMPYGTGAEHHPAAAHPGAQGRGGAGPALRVGRQVQDVPQGAPRVGHHAGGAQPGTGQVGGRAQRRGLGCKLERCATVTSTR